MADTDIVLGIDFDTSNIKKTAQEIQKELNSGFKSGGDSESPALKSIEAQIDKLSQKVSDLADAMRQITGQQGMGASTEAVEGLNSTVQSLIDTLINLAETPAVDPIDIDGVEDATDEMVDVVEEGAEEVTQATSTMLATLVGNFLGSLISHFVVEVVKSAVRLIMRKIREFVQEMKQTVEDLVQLTLSGIKNLLKASGKLAKTSLKEFLKLGTSVIKTLFDSVKLLISKLFSFKSVIVENLKLMAKWKKGSNEVNKALSNLTSSLAYLKGALASVVAPILISIEPMLTRIIDRLAEMLTVIGMLIAKLTGASTFQKAIRKQKDFAKALKDTADALSPLDNLNVISEKNGDAVDWATVTLEDFELPDWLNDLYELGTTVGLKIRDFLRNIPWDSVKEGAEKAAQSIKDFINGILSVRDLGTEIGRAFGELVNTITIFLNELLTGETFYKLGQQAGDAFLEGLKTIDFYALGSIFSNALNGLVDLIIGFFSDNGRGKSTGAKGKELGNAIAQFIATALGGIDFVDINVAINLFMTNLVEAFKALLTPETFSTVATTFTQLINSIFFGADTFTHQMGTKGFNELGNNIATGINTGISKANTGSWGSTISDLANGLLDMLLAAIDGLYDNIDEITDKIVGFLASINWEDLGGKISEISDKLMEAFEQIWQELKDSGTLDRIIDFIVDVLNEKKTWEKAFLRLKKELFWEIFFGKIEQGWENAREWFNGIGKDIIEGILEGFILGLTEIPESVQQFFDAIWAALCGIFIIQSPSQAMNPIGENIVRGILEGFSLVDFLAEVTTWWDENVAPWFDSIQENIDLLTTNIGLKMTAFKDSMIDTFRAIKNGIKIPINYIIAFIEGMVNKIIFGLNCLIDGLSAIKFDVPDNPVLFGVLAGNSFEFDVDKLTPIEIPRLATGGVIPPSMSEHLAMLGDNNAETEVVSPLSTMKEAMLEALVEAGIGNGAQEISINLDGREILKAMVKQNTEYKRQHNGASAFG